jgi:hypothetical protein
MVGLGLVVLLSWVAYSKLSGPEGNPEQKIDGDRDQSAASQHDLEAAAESGGASLEGETGAELEAVAETGGMEIVPTVEPVDTVEEPKPKNGKPRNDKPENGKQENGEPENGQPDGDKPDNGKPGQDPTCEGVEADARAANESRNWKQVAKLTARKACWSVQSERILLRVEALTRMGRIEECIEAGAGSDDPKIADRVNTCKKLAERLKP